MTTCMQCVVTDVSFVTETSADLQLLSDDALCIINIIRRLFGISRYWNASFMKFACCRQYRHSVVAYKLVREGRRKQNAGACSL